MKTYTIIIDFDDPQWGIENKSESNPNLPPDHFLALCRGKNQLTVGVIRRTGFMNFESHLDEGQIQIAKKIYRAILQVFNETFPKESKKGRVASPCEPQFWCKGNKQNFGATNYANAGYEFIDWIVQLFSRAPRFIICREVNELSA